MSQAELGFYHIVTSGEWISKIAAIYGFADWKQIWNAPENADLRIQRSDPNVIYPGDQVYVPQRKLREESCSSDKRHNFVLGKNKKRLKIKLENAVGVPRTNIPCMLVIDTKEYKGLKTDSKGMIDVLISDTAEGGWLFVGGDQRERYQVRLGHLDPIDMVKGYQQRLHNLGHYKVRVAGITGPFTNLAIRAFQERENLIGRSPALKVDGIMGPKTQQALLDRHGY